jgi:pimeloyl-ACP methyl ester carboxylesterase
MAMSAVEVTVRGVSSKKAVVFVHGFSGDAYSTYGMLPAFLAGEPALSTWDIYCFGYPTSLSPDFTGVWSADPDLETLACYFAQRLNDRWGGYSELALVAHSMGGLIVQRALLVGQEALLKRVKHVLFFGTPSGGLAKAGLARLFKQQVRDMAPDSEFLTALSEARRPLFAQPPFTFDAVAGLNDQFVPPRSSLESFLEPFRQRVPGNHLEMVKPPDVAHPTVQLIFRRLLNKTRSVPPPSIRHASVIDRALTLELAGHEDQAIALLQQGATSDPDIAGTLAGRYKRRWLRDPDNHAADGASALKLYADAFREATMPGDAYYTGINTAFMALALYNQRAEAAKVAAQVLHHTAAAPQTKWAVATEAEARLHLGEFTQAIELYRQAVVGLDSRERASMFQQAIWTARLLEQPMVSAQIEALMIV